MHHVVFYEPRYSDDSQDIWTVRGGYKYKSLLGGLHRHAKISVLMSGIPPAGDIHRRALESDFGVNFVPFESVDVPTPDFVGEVAKDLELAMTRIGATVISNLNGRGIGYCYASALAAEQTGADYVLRIAGNDIETRAKVAEERRRPFWGTNGHMASARQERVAAHLASRIIVMTRRERRRAAMLAGGDDKIQVCFRGVDLRHFWPKTAEPTCRRFLFVGRKSFEKGYDILEKAVEILEKAGKDIEVSFAGTFAPREDGMRKYLGFVKYDDLPRTYHASDALIVCSRSEGFPQVVMEAMASGLPCILTRHLFKDDFEHERDCLLTDANPQDVADAMLRLHDDPALFHKLAQASVALSQAEFSQETNQQRYHATLLGH